jgi:hypothetical protein
MMIFEIVVSQPRLHTSTTEERNVIHGTVVAKQRSRDMSEILIRNRREERQLLVAVVSRHSWILAGQNKGMSSMAPSMPSNTAEMLPAENSPSLPMVFELLDRFYR